MLENSKSDSNSLSPQKGTGTQILTIRRSPAKITHKKLNVQQKYLTQKKITIESEIEMDEV